MDQRIKETDTERAFAVHQYYMDIINCMPNIVYWIDMHCNLKGCNHNFVQLLGVQSMRDFVGTPYEKMVKLAGWSEERVESFRLDDMEVLFSGEPRYNVEEFPVYTNKNTMLYFKTTRVPLFDQEKQVIGMVAILTDITDQKISFAREMVLQEPTPLYNTQYHPLVLMVEDNFIAQKIEEAILNDLNCQVDIADSGDKALALFSPGKYDIVLMDIGLQDTSGYIIAKKIRQIENNTGHHVPIIALTSYQADIVKADCNDYSMEGVLTKPLTSEQAKQIIQCYVHHNESIRVSGLRTG